MSAPDNAYRIGSVEGYEPTGIQVECLTCFWMGSVDDLLGVDDDDTLWCPNCRTANWVYA